MNKKQQLNSIAREIEACALCKQHASGKPVPGEGNENALIVFIGEAPGKTEAKTGRPFVGRSGKLLRNMITTMLHLNEKDVYITSPVKYLPDSGTPDTATILHGKTHLEKQLGIINPKIIVIMGATAAKALVTERIQIAKDHGKTIEKNGKLYFLTVHPAAAIRFSKYKSIIENDFKKLQNLLDTASM